MQEEHTSFLISMAIRHKPLSRTLSLSRSLVMGERPLQAHGGSPDIPSREAEPIQKFKAGHQEKVTSCRDFLKKKKTKVSGALFSKSLAPNSNLNEQYIPNKPHAKSSHIIYPTSEQ